MPSPTRAMIVSSVAPPTKRSRCERTVTRAFTFTPMPSLATPSMVARPIAALGTSMIFGLMLVRTASSTVLPVPLVARSIAQAHADNFANDNWCVINPGAQPQLEEARDENYKNQHGQPDNRQTDVVDAL